MSDAWIRCILREREILPFALKSKSREPSITFTHRRILSGSSAGAAPFLEPEPDLRLFEEVGFSSSGPLLEVCCFSFFILGSWLGSIVFWIDSTEDPVWFCVAILTGLPGLAWRAVWFVTWGEGPGFDSCWRRNSEQLLDEPIHCAELESMLCVEKKHRDFNAGLEVLLVLT